MSRSTAQTVCDLINRCGKPQAKGALLMDAGDALWQRC